MKYALYHLVPQSTSLGDEHRRDFLDSVETWEKAQSTFLYYLAAYYGVGFSIESLCVGTNYIDANISDGSMLQVVSLED